MRLARAFGTWDVLVDPGGDVLVVHGGSHTVIARHRTGHPVVLLSGEQPAALTAARLTGLLDLAAAVLTATETERLEHCLAALRRGELIKSTRMELEGVIFTLYNAWPSPPLPPPTAPRGHSRNADRPA